ncbi:MAG: hypothetical protein JWL72_4761 [Ilumatobacteraceae bacterium]|nr:hypothetical protein [Ilumatobacteraceae bacterium]
MRTRSALRPVAVILAVAVGGIGATACGSDAKTPPTTAAVVAAAATEAAAPSASTAASTAAATGNAGAGGTGTTGIDACGQPTPDDVATTFVSSIAFAGADTYDQCFVGDAVSADQIQEIVDKKFSALEVVPDSSNDTYTFTAPDGTKMVIAVAKESNGKFYVSSVTFP